MIIEGTAKGRKIKHQKSKFLALIKLKSKENNNFLKIYLVRKIKL